MESREIEARVGTNVSEKELAEIIRSNPVGTSNDDVAVRGGVLSFSFGPGGVTLIGAEIRKPIDG